MSNLRFRSAVLTANLAIIVVAAPRSSDAQSMLTVERIFSPEFRPQAVGRSRWLDDSTYTMLDQKESSGGSDLVRVDAASGRRSVLIPATRFRPTGAKDPLDVEDYSWSADEKKLLIFTNSARVWRENTRGDFWVLDLASRSLKKLGGRAAKPSTLQFAKFSPDAKRVAYVRDHNLYVESLESGAITPLTTGGSTKIINGTFDWVYEEELGMRDGFRWSPDGQRIAYWQLDANGVRDFLLINNTDSLYSFTIPVQYPKAGTTNSAARIGVVSANGGPTKWVNIPGDPRNNYLARMDWAANSSQLTIQQLNRRQTQNTMWIADAASGTAKPLFVERDSAWIDIYDDHTSWGPGPSLHWLEDKSAFVYLSERDGWRHAWLVSRDGKMRLITDGKYDVMNVSKIDTKGGWLYFYASPENATQMYLWRIKLTGGAPERLTPATQPGTHEYNIGPGARFAIHTRSSWGTPPVVDLVRLPSHETARVLVDNQPLKAALDALAKRPIEFTQVDIGDGTKLDAWVMRPANFDSTKKYPVLFYVYGEPWDQTVVDAYGGRSVFVASNARAARIHRRQRGQSRHAGPKGRDWRKAVRNQIGALRVHDQSSAAKVIGRRMYVDSTRMGDWGWSGGGSSTLLLMFRAPDVYKMGIAVAPVADVHNYDTIYQERYVGLPRTDSAAYYDASAINFAAGLKRRPAARAWVGDDNVHYQGTEQLINALVAEGKQFSMMEYPSRTHGIFEGKGTTTHLYNLLTKYVKDHLPAGPRPSTGAGALVP
jgi:dipeptidyl-peptidase-4